MKKVFWLMASLALPLTLFSGCAATNKLLVNVDSLTARTLPATKTYVLLPGNRDTSASDLQFQEYSTYIHRVLQSKGYTQAESVESASLAVFLSYGIGDPQRHQYSYSVPVWGQTGVSSATTLGTLNTYGDYGTYSGTTYYTPSYGITGYTTRASTYTTHLRFLVMDAYDLQRFRNPKEEVQLWKTTVTSTGSSGDLRRVFPVLVAATKPYIGTNTGKKVEVVLREDDQRVLEIKNPEEKTITGQ